MTTSGSIEGSAPGARSDLLLPLGVVGLLAVLIVPLPTFLLDCLIALNMSLAVLTLLVVLAARDPMEFSTFPSLLLFTTLLRLALNVASTRLILLNSDAGAVIQSFGDFVVGGDLIVGAVIFIILVVIQFVVITKGAGRISEVAARFTLDAMPGKQMAIDADLNAGLISSEDARERREEVSREAEFYGAMDGAQKFVRGDALAGIIITGVNLLGGMAIALSRGTSLGEAAQTYSLLTVGDGLVSQIPALVIATSGGIIVTKAANDRRLGFEMSTQFITNPQTLAMGSLLVLGAALVPGLPAAPFLVLSAVLFGFFRVAKGARDEADRQALKQEEAVSTDAGPESEVQEIVDLLKVDRLSIEIGYRLIHLVEEGGLLDHIAMSRKRFATELGIVIPPVRVKDNLELEPSAYRFYVQGEMIASGEIRSGCFLAMDPGTATGKLEGVKTKEPTFGLPAKWIPQDKKDEAELLGYTVVDGVALMITHFTECVRQYAHDILNRDDVKMLVDQVKESSPTLIEELVPDVVSLGDVQRVLRALLRGASSGSRSQYDPGDDCRNRSRIERNRGLERGLPRPSCQIVGSTISRGGWDSLCGDFGPGDGKSVWRTSQSARKPGRVREYSPNDGGDWGGP